MDPSTSFVSVDSIFNAKKKPINYEALNDETTKERTKMPISNQPVQVQTLRVQVKRGAYLQSPRFASLCPRVDIRYGNCQAATAAIEKSCSPDWPETFFDFPFDGNVSAIVFVLVHAPAGGRKEEVMGELAVDVKRALGFDKIFADVIKLERKGMLGSYKFAGNLTIAMQVVDPPGAAASAQTAMATPQTPTATAMTPPAQVATHFPNPTAAMTPPPLTSALQPTITTLGQQQLSMAAGVAVSPPPSAPDFSGFDSPTNVRGGNRSSTPPTAIAPRNKNILPLKVHSSDDLPSAPPAPRPKFQGGNGVVTAILNLERQNTTDPFKLLDEEMKEAKQAQETNSSSGENSVPLPMASMSILQLQKDLDAKEKVEAAAASASCAAAQTIDDTPKNSDADEDDCDCDAKPHAEDDSISKQDDSIDKDENNNHVDFKKQDGLLSVVDAISTAAPCTESTAPSTPPKEFEIEIDVAASVQADGGQIDDSNADGDVPPMLSCARLEPEVTGVTADFKAVPNPHRKVDVPFEKVEEPPVKELQQPDDGIFWPKKTTNLRNPLDDVLPDKDGMPNVRGVIMKKTIIEDCIALDEFGRPYESAGSANGPQENNLYKNSKGGGLVVPGDDIDFESGGHKAMTPETQARLDAHLRRQETAFPSAPSSIGPSASQVGMMQTAPVQQMPMQYQQSQQQMMMYRQQPSMMQQQFPQQPMQQQFHAPAQQFAQQMMMMVPPSQPQQPILSSPQQQNQQQQEQGQQQPSASSSAAAPRQRSSAEAGPVLSSSTAGNNDGGSVNQLPKSQNSLTKGLNSATKSLGSAWDGVQNIFRGQKAQAAYPLQEQYVYGQQEQQTFPQGAYGYTSQQQQQQPMYMPPSYQQVPYQPQPPQQQVQYQQQPQMPQPMPPSQPPR